MSPEERQVIRRVGLDLLTNWVTIPASVCLCYGILSPIGLMVALNFLRHQDRKFLSLLQLAMTSIGFLAFSAFLVIQIGVAVTGSTFFGSNDVLLIDRVEQIQSRVIKVAIGQNWLQYIPLYVNDAFIMWRAWVISGKRRWILFLLMGLFISSVVSMVVFLSISRNYNFLQEPIPDRIGSFFQLSIAIIIFSFLNNFVATFFTLRTSCHYKNLWKIELGYWSRRTSLLLCILYLTFESGLVYAVLQLTFILMHFLITPDQQAANFARQAFDYAFFSVSFIYPAMALVRRCSTMHDLERVNLLSGIEV